jgi:hypothetical protein
MRGWITVLGVGSLAAGLVLSSPACGGATAGNLAGGGDASTEGGPGGGGAGGPEAGTTPTGDAGGPTTGNPPPCDPPSDPTKAALCIAVTPEAITFTSDPGFDGKGWLIAQLFATPLPDAPDGGEVPSLAAQTEGAPDAGAVDLSQPVPVLRFDGLPAPATVYPRVLFEDDPNAGGSLGPGAWLGGYDLAAGLAAPAPLVAQTLTAGSSTSIAMQLSALRELVVTMTRSVPAAGNGEGPATFVATTGQDLANDLPLFGAGQSPCARVDGTNQAQVRGFVIGAGPYSVVGVLDDFGTGDGGAGLPPGALTSLQPANGTFVIPAADQLTYDPTAYRVAQTLALDAVLPGAPATDGVSCP